MRTTYFGPGGSPNGAPSEGFELHTLQVESGTVLIPSREIMLESMYSRAGSDLILNSPENGKFVIKGFFLSDHPPVLTDGGDTQIAGELATQFAGSIAPGQYAGQAAGAGTP